MICYIVFFFFNDTATTEIYTYRHTLSLHDALPILTNDHYFLQLFQVRFHFDINPRALIYRDFLRMKSYQSNYKGCPRIHRQAVRSEEHTSELQSLMRISYAVFCLKKKTKHNIHQV